MVAFCIVLRHKTVVLDSGFVQKVSCVGFLEQGIADVFLIAQDLVDGACVPPFPPAPVRIPSRSSPAAILSMLSPSKYSR